MFRQLFLTHPAQVGETWAEHRGAALSFAGPLLVAAGACIVHALIPGLFERTASRLVAELHARMILRGTSGVA